MQKGNLILVSGPPCSGKTTIAQQISTALHIPMYTRDAFKEILFDAFNWNEFQDKSFFDTFGYIANENLFYIARQEMQAKRTIIIENVFHPHIYDKIFQKMHEEIPFRTLQLNVRAEGEILAQRFQEREAKKHSGHGSLQQYQFKEFLQHGSIEPLALEGKIIKIDTTDWQRVDIAAIIAQVGELLR